MVFQVAYSPRRAFDRLKSTDALALATALLIIRWMVTPLTTVLSMHLNNSPMLFGPPFGMSPRTYRFYEIFWYGPYGVLIMLAIILALFAMARRCYKASDVTLSKTFEIVSLSFFTPWLPSIPGDWILVATVDARPGFLVPFHLVILAWECALVYIGFRRTLGLGPKQSAFLAFTAGGIFLALGVLLIR